MRGYNAVEETERSGGGAAHTLKRADLENPPSGFADLVFTFLIVQGEAATRTGSVVSAATRGKRELTTTRRAWAEATAKGAHKEVTARGAVESTASI